MKQWSTMQVIQPQISRKKTMDTKKIDVSHLLNDLGGVAFVAKILGGSRTTPYRWLNQNKITGDGLAKIMVMAPTFIEKGYASPFSIQDGAAVLQFEKYLINNK